MRTTILGAVGVLWGGAIVVSGILDRTDSPDAAHVIGDLMALAFGASSSPAAPGRSCAGSSKQQSVTCARSPRA